MTVVYCITCISVDVIWTWDEAGAGEGAGAGPGVGPRAADEAGAGGAVFADEAGAGAGNSWVGVRCGEEGIMISEVR